MHTLPLRSTLFPYTTLFRSSDRPDAAGLQSARERGIETLVIERGARRRQEHDREIVAALAAREIDLVCLAGYMRVLSDRKSTRLNSSHQIISYAVFCLKKKT